MKKVIFLVCLILVSSCSQGEKASQIDDENNTLSGQSEELSFAEHNPDLGGSCTCPYCLGLLDSKDDISLRSL